MNNTSVKLWCLFEGHTRYFSQTIALHDEKGKPLSIEDLGRVIFIRHKRLLERMEVVDEMDLVLYKVCYPSL
jgi:hypothetical protein